MGLGRCLNLPNTTEDIKMRAQPEFLKAAG